MRSSVYALGSYYTLYLTFSRCGTPTKGLLSIQFLFKVPETLRPRVRPHVKHIVLNILTTFYKYTTEYLKFEVLVYELMLTTIQRGTYKGALELQRGGVLP